MTDLSQRNQLRKDGSRYLHFSRHLVVLFVLDVMLVVFASPVKRSANICHLTVYTIRQLEIMSSNLDHDMREAGRIQSANGINGLETIRDHLPFLRSDITSANEALWITRFSNICKTLKAAFHRVREQEGEISRLSEMTSFQYPVSNIQKKLQSLTSRIRIWMQFKQISDTRLDTEVTYTTPCDVTCMSQRNLYVVNLLKTFVYASLEQEERLCSL
ncbi:uncharacterized protein [Apostichopus japonicus]|uniref:uncharacterized protein isoform X2 n=1 Tax=Stichopus japonicus TaxID=307972 RepID=UPI003AB5312E